MYNTIDGYIQTNVADAIKIRTALEIGPIYFSWTDGATHMDIWMLPSRHLKIAWLSPEKTQRGLHHGMVLVAVERRGAFPFNLLAGKEEFWGGYLNEKLGWGDSPDDIGKTIKDLAELFTMISQAGPDRSIIV